MGYGMMGYGGVMLFWWTGGLFLLGAVIYAAVRLGMRRPREDYYDRYDRGPHRDCRGDDPRYYRDDGPYRGDRRWTE